ncbi:MAG: hypothetical protein HFJ22_07350 [Clostridia bacterium]|jgi:hypothetical protein|nr:hypothetical protein [Clostridia bacterium]
MAENTPTKPIQFEKHIDKTCTILKTILTVVIIKSIIGKKEGGSMNMYQQLALGEMKKNFAHNLIDSLTVQGTLVNIQLHNLVEYLSTMEKAHTMENTYRIW